MLRAKSETTTTTTQTTTTATTMRSLNILLVVLLGLTSLEQLFCQDDSMDSRAAVMDPKTLSDGTGGGQLRNIYSQKHFSPHRMMHFGKRPDMLLPPPTLIAALRDDHLPVEAFAQQQQRHHQHQQQQQQLELQQRQFTGIPYTVILKAQTNNNALETSPADLGSVALRNKHLSDIVDYLLDLNNKQNGGQLRQQPTRFMRLLAGETDTSYEVDSELARQQQQQQQQQEAGNKSSQMLFDREQRDSASSSAADQQQQQQQPPPSGEIVDVVERSMPPPPSRMRPFEPFDLTKAHISSLLFGRRITEPPSSLLSLSSFDKKAEPQKMTFMHFG